MNPSEEAAIRRFWYSFGGKNREVTEAHVGIGLLE
jgi:hypothetical protein